MLCGRQLSHLLPPLREKGGAFLPDESRQFIEVIDDFIMWFGAGFIKARPAFSFGIWGKRDGGNVTRSGLNSEYRRKSRTFDICHLGREQKESIPIQKPLATCTYYSHHARWESFNFDRLKRRAEGVSPHFLHFFTSIFPLRMDSLEDSANLPPHLDAEFPAFLDTLKVSLPPAA